MTKKPPSARNFLIARDAWIRTVIRYGLSGADMAVAMALALYFNRKTGTAWPSMETLASDTNTNRTTVWRSVVRLERLGLLTVVHARGRNKSNRYRPALGYAEPAKRKRKRCSLATNTLQPRNKKVAGSQQEPLKNPQVTEERGTPEGATILRPIFPHEDTDPVASLGINARATTA